MKKQIFLTIRGSVQGVFYRATARDRAVQFDLKGWVKNMPNGTVEMCLQGDSAAIQQMIAWCYEGPPGSNG